MEAYTSGNTYTHPNVTIDNVTLKWDFGFVSMFRTDISTSDFKVTTVRYPVGLIVEGSPFSN